MVYNSLSLKKKVQIMEIKRLKFKTINLNRDKDINIAIKFREDSFVISFGDSNLFYNEDGKGHLKYIN